jgi:hypothetical protein
MLAMVKIGWDPKPVIARICLMLNSDHNEEVEMVVDFIRSLSKENHACV